MSGVARLDSVTELEQVMSVPSGVVRVMLVGVPVVGLLGKVVVVTG